jgi:hypothetical protein
MAKVGKDDFVKGFVPHHNHGSVDYTSVEAGHVSLDQFNQMLVVPESFAVKKLTQSLEN